MLAYTMTASRQPPLQIDIIIEESWDFEAFDQRKVFFDQDDISLPLVLLDDLLTMKQKARRAKDILDYSALTHGKGL